MPSLRTLMSAQLQHLRSLSWLLGKPRLQPWPSAPATKGALAPGVCPPAFGLKRCTHLITIALLAVVMLGANDPEARFNKVGHEMMCVCGCGQVLLECNHVGCPDSARMIGELHTQIDANTPSSAILNWFAGKYGATVLAAPIRGGFDNVAWVMPMAVFAFGTLGTAFLVQMWSKKRRLAGNVSTMTVENWEKISPEARALREKIRKETEYQ